VIAEGGSRETDESSPTMTEVPLPCQQRAPGPPLLRRCCAAASAPFACSDYHTVQLQLSCQEQMEEIGLHAPPCHARCIQTSLLPSGNRGKMAGSPTICNRRLGAHPHCNQWLGSQHCVTVCVSQPCVNHQKGRSPDSTVQQCSELSGDSEAARQGGDMLCVPSVRFHKRLCLVSPLSVCLSLSFPEPLPPQWDSRV
jgi:hypothetical protein